jgi:hypothetical protein
VEKDAGPTPAARAAYRWWRHSDQAATSAATSSAVRSLFAVVERSEVRLAANVLALQERSREFRVDDRRPTRAYNDQVTATTPGRQVPPVLLAGLFGWRARPFFEARCRRRPDADCAPTRTSAD